MQCGSLLRISGVHHAAGALLYPLTHPYGDGGFAHHMLPHFARRGGDSTALDPDGLQKGQAVPDVWPVLQQARLLKGMSILSSLDTHGRKKLTFVTLNEYYSYRIQVRQCLRKLHGPLANGWTLACNVHSGWGKSRNFPTTTIACELQHKHCTIRNSVNATSEPLP
jgi:hypothetical protein